MKRILSIFLTLLMVFTVFPPGVSFASNSQVSALVNLLVSKDIISAKEGKEIINEAEKIFAEEKREIKSEVGEAAGVPKWVQNTTFNGDLRVRYEGQRTRHTAAERHRERVRLRWGFTSQITDNLKAGFRIASGGTSNVSTNATLDNAFANKAIGIDKAYLEWQPYEFARLIIGKFRDKKAIFITDDLLWDSDITFEGQMINLETTISDGIKAFLNGGLLILEENLGGASAGEDAFAFVFQPGFDAKVSESTKLKSGIAFYVMRHVKSNPPLTGSNGTNTFDADGDTKENFNVVNPNLQLTHSWEGEDGEDYAIKLIGDFVINPDPKDYGFLAGVKFGNKKVKKFGDWQAGYNFRYLEKDAFVDAFPDGDAFFGNTNVQGHELTLKLGLTRNTTLGFDYYHTMPIASRENPNDLLQVDVVTKFG